MRRVWGGDPTLLPKQRLKTFKATFTKTTDFLHLSNLLSRCGEDGSGVSKALSDPALLELQDPTLREVLWEEEEDAQHLLPVAMSPFVL